ncbi:hypothetical protein SARC_03159 [Sphaeroforma arctica JP610]|uniref:Uncharacterized protein n=1 Tax=Sphaeroforma arctica JP610 TaxID=667725 RepID=A0A0L0G6S8_9EUKA|nr:hypothetical protein SARC_03159 [Sphaeroforma arctica JP610]KNC84629.1 hypothetical protein SARC_03159 [Sphaeroforma arctica JP610]|eukprot:XP_014158531.1 hypothetical protein SARC_03159 [Sphaeroforma arctica JP610]
MVQNGPYVVSNRVGTTVQKMTTLLRVVDCEIVDSWTRGLVDSWTRGLVDCGLWTVDCGLWTLDQATTSLLWSVDFAASEYLLLDVESVERERVESVGEWNAFVLNKKSIDVVL